MAIWVDAVFIEASIFEGVSKKNKPFTVLNLHFRSFQGAKMLLKGFLNQTKDNKTLIDRNMSLIFLAKKAPEMLKEIKEAYASNNAEKIKSFNKEIGKISEELGKAITEDSDKFVKDLSATLKNLQVKMYWESGQIDSFGSESQPSLGRTMLPVYILKQKEEVAGIPIDEFTQQYAEGSVMERTSESLKDLDAESENESAGSQIESDSSEKPEKKKKKKSNIDF